MKGLLEPTVVDWLSIKQISHVFDSDQNLVLGLGQEMNFEVSVESRDLCTGKSSACSKGI